jgi:hypothetical protein
MMLIYKAHNPMSKGQKASVATGLIIEFFILGDRNVHITKLSY